MARKRYKRRARPIGRHLIDRRVEDRHGEEPAGEAGVRRTEPRVEPASGNAFVDIAVCGERADDLRRFFGRRIDAEDDVIVPRAERRRSRLRHREDLSGVRTEARGGDVEAGRRIQAIGVDEHRHTPRLVDVVDPSAAFTFFPAIVIQPGAVAVWDERQRVVHLPRRNEECRMESLGGCDRRGGDEAPDRCVSLTRGLTGAGGGLGLLSARRQRDAKTHHKRDSHAINLRPRR